MSEQKRQALLPQPHEVIQEMRVIQIQAPKLWETLLWGGLRTPSEHFGLKWGAIHWEERMMTILSPKTERLGKESRETPQFPELVPYLRKLKSSSKDMSHVDYVICHRRLHSEANVRNQMYHLCDKAGVTKWPKIFQNLRSTRQTILERSFPRGTVCAWMGNTEDVAEARYVQEMKEFRAIAADTPTHALAYQRFYLLDVAYVRVNLAQLARFGPPSRASAKYLSVTCR